MKYLVFLLMFFLAGNTIAKNKQLPFTSTDTNVLVRQRLRQIDERLNKIDEYEKRQEEIIKQTTQTIANQNSVISSFGIIYTILTIVITIVAIGLPLVAYQFGIKPSRDALKELEINLDKRVANYLKATRTEQIKSALADLKGDNNELKTQAIAFLSLTHHQGFTDQEFFELYRILRSSITSDVQKANLVFLLSTKVNDYATEMFTDPNTYKMQHAKYYGYQYLAKIGFAKGRKIIKEVLTDNENQLGELITMIGPIGGYDSRILIKIINDEEIVNKLKDDTIKAFKDGGYSLVKHGNVSEEEYDTSYLKKRLDELIEQ